MFIVDFLLQKIKLHTAFEFFFVMHINLQRPCRIIKTLWAAKLRKSNEVFTYKKICLGKVIETFQTVNQKCKTITF